MTLYTSTLANNVVADWTVAGGLLDGYVPFLYVIMTDGTTFALASADSDDDRIYTLRRVTESFAREPFDPHLVDKFLVRNFAGPTPAVPCELTRDDDPTNVPPANRRPDACAVVRGSGVATITWTPAPNDNADRYVLYRSAGPALWVASTAALSGDAQFIIDGPLVNAEFSIQTKAVDGTYTSARRCSIEGDPLDIPKPPPPTKRPRLCRVYRGDGVATITWSPQANDIADRYLLYRPNPTREMPAWVDSTAANGGDPSFTVTGELADADFGVKVRGLRGDFTPIEWCISMPNPERPVVTDCSVTLYTSTRTKNLLMSWTPTDGFAAEEQVNMKLTTGRTFVLTRGDTNNGRLTTFQYSTNPPFDPELADQFSIGARSADYPPFACSLTRINDPASVPPVNRAPDVCKVLRTDGVATITWTPAPNDNADRYVLYKSGAWAGSTGAVDGATEFVVTDESGFASFEMQTRGFDGEFTDNVRCTGQAAGSAPLACSYGSARANERIITFTPDSGDNAERYLLYRSENGVGWQWSASIPASAASALRYEELSDIEYGYAVKTKGTDGGFTTLTVCAPS